MPLLTLGCSLCAIYSGTPLFKNENENEKGYSISKNSRSGLFWYVHCQLTHVIR